MSDDHSLAEALKNAAGGYKEKFKIGVVREHFDDIAQAMAANVRLKAILEIFNAKTGLEMGEELFRSYIGRVRTERKYGRKKRANSAATAIPLADRHAAEPPTTAQNASKPSAKLTAASSIEEVKTALNVSNVDPADFD